MGKVFYSGRVHSVIFENTAQDFYILKMDLDDNGDMFQNVPHNITVRGHVPGLRVDIGTWFGFEAKWDNHEQYGKQLVITRAPVIDTWTPDVACSILSSHGVGSQICGRLLSQFGDNLITILDLDDPDALRDIPGMTPFAAAHVLNRWKSAKAYFKTLEFLSEAGVPKGRVSQVWSTFEGEAVEVLSKNPWALVRIDGITFDQADEVARRLGLDMGSQLRKEGAILYTCKDQKGMGHLYMSTGEVYAGVQKIIPSTTTREAAQAIASLHKEGSIVIDKETKPGVKAIYEPWIYHIEQEGARLLVERVKSARLDPGAETTARYVKDLAALGSIDTKDLEVAARSSLDDWAKGSKLVLSGLQLEGAFNALTKPVSIITGLPGTGKSTLLRAVVRIFQDAGVSFLLVAPTGIAAKRITALTGAPASTIHRGFGARGWNKGGQRESTYVGIVGDSTTDDKSDGSGEIWKCSKEPHPADVIIVDEASMVDQHLLFRILECSRSTTRLVLVGDAAQLPSVGPGNVLRDLIGSCLFPTVSLTEIFRQEETSDIVVAAHAIHSGKVPYTEDTSSDFVFLPCRSEEQILEIVVKLAVKLYDKRENFQVMSPRHGGTLGVTNINARLRGLLNPKQPGLQEMRVGSEIVREDDRVMVVKNNYLLDIFNGDVGKVGRIDRKKKVIQIKIHGPPTSYVEIPFKDASSHLRLAYAVTVHKMQGQEASCIIMPLVKGFAHQLQRNLLYTAITRAKERVFLVGHPEALNRAVSNNRPDARNTLFPERLAKVFP